jgi:hypothetical protein
MGGIWFRLVDEMTVCDMKDLVYDVQFSGDNSKQMVTDVPTKAFSKRGSFDDTICASYLYLLQRLFGWSIILGGQILQFFQLQRSISRELMWPIQLCSLMLLMQ